MTRRQSGLTLLETLVVLGIIGILLAVLIPAVQSAREAARRSACKNNMRQLVLATQSYESARASLPSLYNGTFLKRPRNAIDEFHFHSWRTAILPELEQSGLYQRIDLSLPATDVANQSTLNAKVAIFLCPSTGNINTVVPEIYGFGDGTISKTNVIGTAARSDYEVVGGVSFQPSGTADLHKIRFGAWGEPRYRPGTGISISYRTARFQDSSDGLSNTILVAERAGRPDWYRRGKPVEPYPYSNPNEGMDHHQAAWGLSTHFWSLVFWHEHSVNETNATGIYSFHPAGANVGLADGSVRFLSESIDQDTLNALATRAEGDAARLR